MSSSSRRAAPVLSSFSFLALAACAGQAPPASAPLTQAVPPAPLDPFAAPVDVPPPRPRDQLTIGTFNLDWAFDEIDDRPEIGNEQNADTEESWDWKLDAIASILAKAELDVVALQSIGGERELFDLVVKIKEHGGPNYNTAFVENEDRLTGLQTAILSKHLVMNEFRFDVRVPRHVAAEISLPDGDSITVVNVHLRGGHYKMQRELRTKEAEKIRRKVTHLAATMPVVVLGDMTADVLPATSGYRESSAGILAGATTRSEDDDCLDSATFDEATETDGEDQPNDRIIACGFEMLEATVTARDQIIRGEEDPEGTKWFEVPVDASPHRDVSDHLMVRATLKIPTESDPANEGPDASAPE